MAKNQTMYDKMFRYDTVTGNYVPANMLEDFDVDNEPAQFELNKQYKFDSEIDEGSSVNRLEQEVFGEVPGFSAMRDASNWDVEQLLDLAVLADSHHKDLTVEDVVSTLERYPSALLKVLGTPSSAVEEGEDAGVDVPTTYLQKMTPKQVVWVLTELGPKLREAVTKRLSRAGKSTDLTSISGAEREELLDSVLWGVRQGLYGHPISSKCQKNIKPQQPRRGST